LGAAALRRGAGGGVGRPRRRRHAGATGVLLGAPHRRARLRGPARRVAGRAVKNLATPRDVTNPRSRDVTTPRSRWAAGSRWSSLAGVSRAGVAWERCPRPRAHCERVAREKRRAYGDEEYWGRPVPGFGDPRARLVIVGLAPGAHGSNRTGRMFTGD